MTFYYFWVEVGFCLFMWLPLTLQEEGSLTVWKGWKSWLFPQLLVTPPWRGWRVWWWLGCLVTGQWRYKYRVPAWLSHYSSEYGEGVSSQSNKRWSLGYPPSLSWWGVEEGQNLFLLYFAKMEWLLLKDWKRNFARPLLVLWLGRTVFCLPNLVDKRNKENPGNKVQSDSLRFKSH